MLSIESAAFHSPVGANYADLEVAVLRPPIALPGVVGRKRALVYSAKLKLSRSQIKQLLIWAYLRQLGGVEITLEVPKLLQHRVGNESA